MKKQFRRWGPAVVIMTVIFIASATPGNDLPSLEFGDLIFKKGGHMLGYALLAITYFHALKNNRGIMRFRFAISACLAVLFAASDEWHQRFTPGRNSSVWDVCIDSAGAYLGLLLWSFIQRRHSRRREIAVCD